MSDTLADRRHRLIGVAKADIEKSPRPVSASPLEASGACMGLAILFNIQCALPVPVQWEDTDHLTQPELEVRACFESL